MLHSRIRPLPRRSKPQPDNSRREPDVYPAADSLKAEAAEEEEVEEEVEDLFASFLPHLLPDDAPSFHGDPGQLLQYVSPLYGNLEILVPSYPGQSDSRNEEIAAGQRAPGDDKPSPIEAGRRLFAHFLWSAALVVAEGVENAAAKKSGNGMWDVDGQTVLELGAGAGLPSIISALSGASKVAITDHPSSPALAGTIECNIARNIPTEKQPIVSVQPHEWGVLDDGFSQAHRGAFSRIIAADCLWMPEQHENLVRTALWFLPEDPSKGRVWVVAGFHTGRAIVAAFFETAARLGLAVESIYERDVNASSDEEVRRDWTPAREGEGVHNRGRWCVVAILKRATCT